MRRSDTCKDETRTFEFLLQDIPERDPLYADAVTEFFRQQVINLLDVVMLTTDGELVKIDGFAFLRNPIKIYELWQKA